MGKHDRKEKTRKGDRDRDRDRDRSERGRGKKGGERWRKGATADADEAKFAASLASMRPPLCVKSIVGDGNCLFRSIADQLHGDESQHPRIRAEIVAHMQQKIDHYSLFIEDDEPADDYFARMASPCEWGGNLELYACCERYRVHVAVFQVDGPCFTLSPESVGTEAGGAGNGKAKPSRGHKSKLGAAEAASSSSSSSSLRSIALSFHGECHYNSVRLTSDPGQPGEPAAEVRPPAPAPHVAAGTKVGVEAGQDVQEEGEEEENEEGEDNGGIAAEPGAEGQGEGEWGEAAPDANPSIDPDTEPGPDPGPDPGPVPDPGAAAERRAHRAQQKAQQKAERQREALKRMQKMAARALVMAAGFRLQQQAALSRKAARKAEKAQAKAEKARAEGGGGEGVGAGGAGQEGVGHLSESMATIAI